MRMKSILANTSLLLAGAVWLSSCASIDTVDDIAATGSITRQTDAPQPSLAVDVPVTQALVTVPASLGAVIAVSEQRTTQNGKTTSITQRVALKGDARTLGENTIDVTLRRTQPGEAPSPVTDADLATYGAQALAGLSPVTAHSIVTTGLGQMAVAEAMGPTQRCAIALGRKPAMAETTAFHGGMQMEVKARFCSGSKSFAAIEAGLAGLAPRGSLATAFVDHLDTPQHVSGDALDAAGGHPSASPIRREISPAPEKIVQKKVAPAKALAQVAEPPGKPGNPGRAASVAVPLPDSAPTAPRQIAADKPAARQTASTTAVPMP